MVQLYRRVAVEEIWKVSFKSGLEERDVIEERLIYPDTGRVRSWKVWCNFIDEWSLKRYGK